MAIDNSGISSLDTGASDITYTGNEGPKSPQEEQQMQMASLMQEYKDYAMQQEEAGRPIMPFEEWVRSMQSPMAYGGSANPTYTQSRKQQMAYGGTAGADGRRRYGIGSWFQEKIMDPIKKVIPNELKAIAKSPIGKAALMYAGGAGLGALAAGSGGTGLGLSMLKPSNVLSNIGTGIGRGVTGVQKALGVDKAIADSLKMNIVPEGAQDIIKGATTPYQNIFQTGAVSQTPGYRPPAPAGTGEGLGSINPFEQPGARTAIPKAPVINPFEQPGARTAIPRPPVRSRIQDERAEDIRKRALGNIALQTDKSLTDVYDPSGRGQGQGQGQGIMSSLMDTGKSMVGNQLKKGVTSFALKKLGLGFLNPFLGLASLFGKDPIGALMAKFPKGTGTKTAWQPDESSFRGQGQGQAQAPANVIQAGMEQFQPTDQQTSQMDEIRRKMLILQGYADKGSLNEQGMSTLAQMNQMISQYQADPRSIYG